MTYKPGQKRGAAGTSLGGQFVGPKSIARALIRALTGAPEASGGKPDVRRGMGRITTAGGSVISARLPSRPPRLDDRIVDPNNATRMGHVQVMYPDGSMRVLWDDGQVETRPQSSVTDPFRDPGRSYDAVPGERPQQMESPTPGRPRTSAERMADLIASGAVSPQQRREVLGGLKQQHPGHGDAQPHPSPAGVGHQDSRAPAAHEPLSSDPAVRQVQIDNRVRQAYADVLAGQSGTNSRWVGLADLRAQMGDDVSRHEVDSALKRLEQADGVNIVPESNQKTLTPADRAAAVVIGDQQKHAITMDDPSPRPLPAHTPTAPGGTGPVPVVPGAAPKAPRKAAAKVAAAKASAEPPHAIAARLHASTDENEARAMLSGLTVKQLNEVAAAAGLERQSGRKAEIVDRISYQTVGHRVDSAVLRTRGGSTSAAPLVGPSPLPAPAKSAAAKVRAAKAANPDGLDAMSPQKLAALARSYDVPDHGTPASVKKRLRAAGAVSPEMRQQQIASEPSVPTPVAAPSAPAAPGTAPSVTRYTGTGGVQGKGLYGSEPSGEPPTDPRRAVEVENAVRQSYSRLASRPGALVKLTDLRARLGDRYSRSEVDHALQRMNRTSGANLAPRADQRLLSGPERTDSIIIGNQDKHDISIYDTTPAPLPDVPGLSAAPPAPGKAAARVKAAKAATPPTRADTLLANDIAGLGRSGAERDLPVYLDGMSLDRIQGAARVLGVDASGLDRSAAAAKVSRHALDTKPGWIDPGKDPVEVLTGRVSAAGSEQAMLDVLRGEKIAQLRKVAKQAGISIPPGMRDATAVRLHIARSLSSYGA